MTVLEALEEYGKIIKDNYKSSIATEHTLRTPFENLLNAIKPKEIKVVHEAVKEEFESGTPDFKIFKQIDSAEKLTYPNLIGYIECKKLNEDLDKIIKTPQIKKYLEVSPNILVTDYNRFILLSFEKKISDISLFEYGLSEKTLFDHENTITQDKADRLQFILTEFFNSTARKIKSKQELVRVLSTQAFYLGVKTREFIENKTNQHSKFTKFFTKTYESFKEAVNYEFDIKEFCDIFGQSIVYGLLVAHIEMKDDENARLIDESDDFINFLPSEFALLAEFLYFSTPSFSVPVDVSYTIENIKKTVVLIDQEKIAKELNTNIDGISIYLYEDFLKDFDNLKNSEKRKEGGVYYTPEPVVQFIVKSINQILKTKLNQNKGFSSENVKTLDFATGTGSFLAEVFETIIKEEKSPVFKIDNIKNKFLKDVYGFEMMFVPYIVAHLKLSKILKKEGFNSFNDENKLQIYLTNTLDLEQRGLHMSMPLLLLEEEHQKAQKIKNSEDILVILGNPPYNNKSKNRGNKIIALLDKYKKDLNETKINLDDDYIKFIRFADWKLIDQWQSNLISPERKGVMGFITNNSFIWGRTHRQMRKSLYENFDEIYILNLHGGKTDNKEDKNVFDIQTGVCISFFIKYSNDIDYDKKVYYFSTQDNGVLSRSEKFVLLKENIIDSINWKRLEIKEPYYWFIDKDLSKDEYESDPRFWKMDDIFGLIGSGVKTDRDTFFISKNKESLEEVIKTGFSGTYNEYFAKEYNMKDSSSYKFIDKLKNSKFSDENITKIAYRPFDKQYIYFDTDIISRPNVNISNQLLKNNVGLVFSKAYQENVYDVPFVSNSIIDIHLSGGQSYIAPLYLYKDEEDLLEDGVEKISNFTKDFEAFIDSQNYNNASPENILGYVYAILYTPAYRTNYYEYLKIDYPKIPFTYDAELFEKLSQKGLELARLHLMLDIPEDSNIVLDFVKVDVNTNDISYIIQKFNAKDRYKNKIIYLNNDLCIKDIDEGIWNYTIGGYQVIDKWLKYRVDYECSRDDLEHLVNICKVIEKTIQIQQELDTLYDI
jgi:predicted helicase